MPTTLSQLETAVRREKSRRLDQPLPVYVNPTLIIPSGYTQSVIGHGRQQEMLPCSDGTEAQARPLSTVTGSAKASIEILRHEIVHPPWYGKFDCCKKGIGQPPRPTVNSPIATNTATPTSCLDRVLAFVILCRGCTCSYRYVTRSTCAGGCSTQSPKEGCQQQAMVCFGEWQRL